MARSKVTSTADAPRHSGFGPTVAVNLLGSAKCANNALQPVNRNWLKQYVVAEAGRYRHVDGNTAVLKLSCIGESQVRWGRLVVAANQHRNLRRSWYPINERQW